MCKPGRRHWLASLLAAIAAAFLLATPVNAEPVARSVLVLGGTGQLGRAILAELSATHAVVSVFARENSSRAGIPQRAGEGRTIEWLVGDLLNEADIDRAFAGRRIDIVINAVRVEDGDVHFYEKIMGPLVRNARRAGVQQFIHHSAVGAGDNVEKFRNLGWERVPGIFERLKDQGIAETLLRESGVPYTIIRNARLYPASQPATGKAVLTEDDSVITPMTRADLARLTVGCIGDPRCVNQSFHVSDPSLRWPLLP